MMGGRIWLESEPGKGSAFHFTARFGIGPCRIAAPVPDGRLNESALHGVPVLIVDDNATNRRILKEVVSRWGMRPVAVEAADAALDLMRHERTMGTGFPLVLLDAQMPGIDGFTLARAIKQDPDLAGAAIMMISSSDLHGDARRCRDLGITTYLIKPINQVELRHAVLRTLGASPQPELESLAPALSAGTASETADQPRTLRILLAEDNVVNQKLMVRVLGKRGHSVAVAGDGLQALELFNKLSFDLVFMDVQMPEMGGFEATRIIRQNEAATGRRIPIIALTAHAMTGDRERYLDQGFDHYVAKPILDEAELLGAIERLLQPR